MTLRAWPRHNRDTGRSQKHVPTTSARPHMHKARKPGKGSSDHDLRSRNATFALARCKMRRVVEPRVVLVQQEGLQHYEGCLGLVLGHHVPGAPDRQEVKATFVAGHEPTHAQLPVPRPGPPSLDLREADVGGPVLGIEAVEPRISVTVVDQHADALVVGDTPIPRQHAGLCEVVCEAGAIVRREELGVVRHVQGFVHPRRLSPDRQHRGASTGRAIHVPLAGHRRGSGGALRGSRALLHGRAPVGADFVPLLGPLEGEVVALVVQVVREGVSLLLIHAVQGILASLGVHTMHQLLARAHLLDLSVGLVRKLTVAVEKLHREVRALLRDAGASALRRHA
mmetsp:Transcript_77579/g.222191  ORF Transcript_77579/g.222191 Transcript_77579/m.222191 type:complete len:339 (-) Transcript_77579:738-1754(-)